MSTVEIYKATIDDVKKLQSIGRQTFFETFADENSQENINKYLNESFADEKLLAELNNPNSYFYLAVSENNVIGYLKLNTANAQTEKQADDALEIQRIYVSKEFHGKKVAQTLYAQAEQMAKEIKASYMWLGVWEKNFRAVSFYTKNGFVKFDTHIFRFGDEEQIDLLMKKVL
ncbi:ribosomal protein S18 acetylase RimI-like enzyme [Flavobacterium nitrogenifigens]|uniref:Ribosomal protein S18 acetylase RimI-like enzyme n=2 Tax=Flavobacterium TaxID=237 RepID=A0A7W7IYZ7_9FLAO|nr:MULTISPECIES: GNAT family N-acetyltransferase [Flavobacterium]MBB4802722.1 ribosomal protein S18 acetylase RimI-like enzyme [Flavobacterium nitrogenifigens]MBB6387680.1 ribosomal protein S18 acetylase RimI-like enzyme [Flavobacterium notoginsengisoli]